ncbi:TMED10 [Lepeophtheirus salmonis]|uniref:TMED10 n=1 Tax=Lepeophtheirus salmonis TaxID=72036 RepID=A0A7R8HB24_LEPSM|nr:TMED10 [Lepeophtheirus salmonis]CAF2979741.1 TMED10 [Lepeophtheirus salmonis]
MNVPSSVSLVLILASTCHALMFHLEPNGRKCLKEEINKDILVSGEYEVTEVPGQVVDLIVVDSKGQHFVSRQNADKGKFAFTTDETNDAFEVCFISQIPAGHHGSQQEIFLSVKHGVEAKSYEGLGDAAKLKPLEVELKRLEDLSESIVQDFAHMRRREEEHEGYERVNQQSSPLFLHF